MESPPPENPDLNEIKLKRFRPIWRILLISNMALGAYIFAQPRAKHVGGRKGAKNDVKVEIETEPETETETEALPPPPPPVVVKVKEPITEDKQRELFQWILEEKRKVKPANNEEKKRINEDKAILKQFIRADSLPTF